MVVELQADEGRRGRSPRLGLTPVARESSVCQIGRKVASADPAENSNERKVTSALAPENSCNFPAAAYRLRSAFDHRFNEDNEIEHLPDMLD